MENGKLVQRWMKAYEARNHKPAPALLYKNGWYELPSGRKVRQAFLLIMTENLEGHHSKGKRE